MATVYQHSTLAALMAGLLGGTITVGELKEHGDTGIGTLHGVDGEVIILNGEVYQAESSGKVNHITDMSTLVPFATVHQAHGPESKAITLKDVTLSNVDVINEYNLYNNFSGIGLHGEFSHIKVRIAPKASEPFPSLLEITKQQPVFERENVSGTLVGYYSPELYHGVLAAGWHVQFISDDRQFAGHVLEFQAPELTGSLVAFSDYQLHLPIENTAFREHHLDMNGLREGVTAAEGNTND